MRQICMIGSDAKKGTGERLQTPAGTRNTEKTAGNNRPDAGAGLSEMTAEKSRPDAGAEYVKMRKRSWPVITAFLLVCLLLSGCAGKNTEETGARKVGEVTQQGSGVTTSEGTGNSVQNDPLSEESADNTQGQAGRTSSNINSSTNSDANKSNETTGAKTSSATPKLFHVGDIVEDRDLRIVYMASGEHHEKSEYLQPPAGQKYIFLEFSFENRGKDQDRSLSIFSFQCYADGFAAQAYYGGRNDLAPSLPPGRRTTGRLYFTVPEEAKEIDVEYKPHYLSDEKIRFLYDGEKDSGYVPEPDPSRTAGAFAVGDTAETDRQRITCVSCEEDDSDNEFIRPADGCSYYTLLFEIENLESAGGDDQEAGVYNFHCYADGADCSSTLFRDDYLTAVISPGRRARGTVTFEVPDDAQTVEVEYRPLFGKVRSLVFTVR